MVLRPAHRSALLAAALTALALALAASAGAAGRGSGDRLEVVVTLRSPAAAGAPDPKAALARIAREQQGFVRALHRRIPEAEVRWRFRTVANGLAVVVPLGRIESLRSLPGVRSVDVPVRYRAQRAAGPREIGAQALWGATLANQGQGMKIAVIDDGIDQTHPYFSPAGYTMPDGFPKGQKAYTTAKVIVARSFPPAGATYVNAPKPFDPEQSDHATHVAGIAAGNADTKGPSGQPLSGVAPKAYLGNYKALTIPTDAGVGLDGNAPEIVAAIEAAVNDGMDVINLSIGEPEVEPSRDLVALALDAAAAAGVVSVVAAGNDYASYGRGSVTSPGNSREAITVAATTQGASTVTAPEIAGFSSAGPTALSLRLKPDVSAPGSSILSSVPTAQWRTLSGTSMAAPHVAGAVALLRQLHPDWTPRQVKAALVATARPAMLAEGGEAPPTRAGSGSVDLAAATDPRIVASPTGVTFGLVRTGTTSTQTVTLEDAGGGSGTWNVTVAGVETAGEQVTAPAQVTVPGELALTLTASGPSVGEVSGVVRLEQGGVVRRIPYWARVTRPALASLTPTPLTAPGTYSGDTRRGTATVDRYVYPELPLGGTATSVLRGPEQVFRVRIRKPVANFGVVVLTRSRGATVEPRIVAAGDESRLMGYAALPININPYLADFESPTLASGVLRPAPGAFDVVFDSTTAVGAGSFTFRYWVDDVTPPTVTVATRTVRRGRPVLFRVSDSGAGIDPKTIVATVGGNPRAASLIEGGRTLRVSTLGLVPGTHRVRVQVSDYQETRNNENVTRILPNTRVVALTITVAQ